MWQRTVAMRDGPWQSAAFWKTLVVTFARHRHMGLDFRFAAGWPQIEEAGALNRRLYPGPCCEYAARQPIRRDAFSEF